MGVTQSMGRVGPALDNVAAEAGSSTIQVELVHRTRFATRAQARRAVGGWTAGFCRTRRRHTACGSLSRIAYDT